MKIIDAIVPEPPGGPGADPDLAARLLKAALMRELGPLLKRSPDRLVQDRAERYLAIGTNFIRDVERRAVPTEHGTHAAR
jgi:acetyl-CoA carboxylase alpha subunit